LFPGVLLEGFSSLEAFRALFKEDLAKDCRNNIGEEIDEKFC